MTDPVKDNSNMAATSAHPAARTRAEERCLARSLLHTLAEEPTLEAVTIDRANQKISVATLGRTDVEKLTARISHDLETVQSVSQQQPCRLLDGQDRCDICDTPLSAAERSTIFSRIKRTLGPPNPYFAISHSP